MGAGTGNRESNADPTDGSRGGLSKPTVVAGLERRGHPFPHMDAMLNEIALRAKF